MGFFFSRINYAHMICSHDLTTTRNRKYKRFLIGIAICHVTRKKRIPRALDMIEFRIFWVYVQACFRITKRLLEHVIG